MYRFLQKNIRKGGAILLGMLFFANKAQGQIIDNDELVDPSGSSQAGSFADAAGFSKSMDNTVGGIVATVIEAFLGLLAIIFIILMIVAGYKWMTAAGNEDKVKEARTQIKNAVIGLAIIIMAYAITYFVFEALGDTMGGGGSSFPL